MNSQWRELENLLGMNSTGAHLENIVDFIDISEHQIRLPLSNAQGHPLSFVVDAEDALSVPKAMMALTMIRSSFDHYPPVDEKEVERIFGVKAPAGFYLLVPTDDGKGQAIASAMFASLGGHPPEADSFLKMAPNLLKKGILDRDYFMTVAEYDLDQFFSSGQSFPDALRDGIGEKRSLTENGVRIRSVRPADRASENSPLSWFDCYPAPLALNVTHLYEEQAAADEFSSLRYKDAARYLIPLADMAKMPYFNHNGASDIQNPRDLADPHQRAGFRQEVVESMFIQWRFAQETEQKILELDKLSPDEVKYARAKIKRDQVLGKEPFGGDRQIAYIEEKTAFYGSKDLRVVLSADFTLVNGGHSSRDYSFIHHVFSSPQETLYWKGAALADCNESNFKQRFSKLVKEPASAAVFGQKPNIDELWSDFSSFVRKSSTTEIKLSPYRDAAIARDRVRQSNNQQALSKASRAQFDVPELKEMVGLANSHFKQNNIPKRVCETKAVAGSDKYAASTEGTVSLEDLFPYLAASTIAPNKLTTSDRQRFESLARVETVALLARSNAGEKKAAIDMTSPLFDEIHSRMFVLLSSAAALKGRPISMTEKTAKVTVDGVLGSGKLTAPMQAFAQLAAKQKMAQLSPDELLDISSPGETPVLLRKERVGLMVQRAIDLQEKMEKGFARAYGNSSSNSTLSGSSVSGDRIFTSLSGTNADTFNAVILLMAAYREFEWPKAKLGAKNAPDAGSTIMSERSFEAIDASIERIIEMGQNSAMTNTNFNQAREALNALVKDLVGKKSGDTPQRAIPNPKTLTARMADPVYIQECLDYSVIDKMDPINAELLLNFVPGVGASWADWMRPKQVAPQLNGSAGVLARRKQASSIAEGAQEINEPTTPKTRKSRG